MNQVEDKILSIFQKRLKEPKIAKYTERDSPDAILEFENNEGNLVKAES